MRNFVGVLSIYIDGALARKVEKINKRREITFPATAGRTFHLRGAFSPGRDTSKTSEATVELKVVKADIRIDKCMGVKDWRWQAMDIFVPLLGCHFVA